MFEGDFYYGHSLTDEEILDDEYISGRTISRKIESWGRWGLDPDREYPRMLWDAKPHTRGAFAYTEVLLEVEY